MCDRCWEPIIEYKQRQEAMTLNNTYEADPNADDPPCSEVEFTAAEWQMIRDAVSSCAYPNSAAGDALHAKLRGLSEYREIVATIRTA